MNKWLLIGIIVVSMLLVSGALVYFIFIRELPTEPPLVFPVENDTEEASPGNETVVNETTETNLTPEILPLNLSKYYNISEWHHDQIIQAIDKKIPGFLYELSFPIVYLVDDEQHYRYDTGRIPKIYEDPFWIIRSRYESGVLAYPNRSDFRMGVPVTSRAFQQEIARKKQDVNLKSIYPKTHAEWVLLDCYQIESCRDIYAVQCLKKTLINITVWNNITLPSNESNVSINAPNSTEESTYLTEAVQEQVEYTYVMYMWTPEDAEKQRYFNFPFTMQSDTRDMLDVFEDFYCSPIE
ncbi:MAG: hypothetical protein ABIH34_02780 [Nanoarchaeota archaeon]